MNYPSITPQKNVLRDRSQVNPVDSYLVGWRLTHEISEKKLLELKAQEGVNNGGYGSSYDGKYRISNDKLYVKVELNSKKNITVVFQS